MSISWDVKLSSLRSNGCAALTSRGEAPANAPGNASKEYAVMHAYYDSINLIERLHRHFLDVLKVELDRLGLQDVNNVQALILFNIGDDEMTVGELTARGYYLGSNVSYNLKKMVENNYLVQERSIHDRRSVRIKLSPKGADLRKKVAALFERQIGMLDKAGFTEAGLKEANDMLLKLERFWTSQIGFAGLSLSSAA
jgi:DNA-binding MarR family transcriptional regulator